MVSSNKDAYIAEIKSKVDDAQVALFGVCRTVLGSDTTPGVEVEYTREEFNVQVSHGTNCNC